MVLSLKQLSQEISLILWHNPNLSIWEEKLLILFSHMLQLYTYTCRIHFDAMNKRRAKTSLQKYTSHFIWKGCVCERVLETEQRLQYIDPPLLWPSALCLSCSPGLLTRRPGGPLCWLSLLHLVSLIWSPTHWGSRGPLLPGGGFLYHILPPTSLISNSIAGPKGPFCRVVAFSTTSYLQLLFLQLTDFLSSPSYIIVQLPTQSLEWRVWSSSSGNNCHAVQRSLSSGASVYECVMGFLPCPIFLAKPAYVISSHKCHQNVSLPSSASHWNGMFGQQQRLICHKTQTNKTKNYLALLAFM